MWRRPNEVVPFVCLPQNNEFLNQSTISQLSLRDCKVPGGVWRQQLTWRRDADGRGSGGGERREEVGSGKLSERKEGEFEVEVEVAKSRGYQARKW